MCAPDVYFFMRSHGCAWVLVAVLVRCGASERVSVCVCARLSDCGYQWVLQQYGSGLLHLCMCAPLIHLACLLACTLVLMCETSACVYSIVFACMYVLYETHTTYTSVHRLNVLPFGCCLMWLLAIKRVSCLPSTNTICEEWMNKSTEQWNNNNKPFVFNMRYIVKCLCRRNVCMLFGVCLCASCITYAN